MAALQQLLSPRFFRDQYCDLELCTELAELLLQIIQRVSF